MNLPLRRPSSRFGWICDSITISVSRSARLLQTLHRVSEACGFTVIFSVPNTSDEPRQWLTHGFANMCPRRSKDDAVEDDSRGIARDICFGTRRLKFLPSTISLLLTCPAGAADGPCELEAGMWASPVEACHYVMKPSEAVSLRRRRVA
jgi:hypothetical protein